MNVNTGNVTETILFTSNVEAKSSAGWEMNVSPVFFMTQNFGSLILYNKVVFQEIAVDQPKSKRKPTKNTVKRNTANPNEKVVVVISDPIAEPDYRGFWSNNDGARFLGTLAEMYKESLSCLLYTSPSPRDRQKSRMPCSA